MAGYTRQSTFADGDTITAALFNNEYNQVLNAFSNTGGHKHDGTAAEGPVIGLIGDAGVVTPLNKVLIDSTNDHIEFWVDVSSSSVQQLYIADGAIVPVTDSDVDLGTTGLRFKDAYIDTVTTTGNVAVGGNLTVTGTTTFNGGTITMGDAATDNVVFGADVDSNIIPDDDDAYDLGSSSQEWRNLYIDGTANIDSLVADTADINGGTIDGATIATSDITVGSGKTLNVSAGTLTLADNQISGDKVEGGTIAATTITTLASTTGNITTVNSTTTNATTVDSTNLEVTNLKAKDGTAAGSIANSTGVVTLGSSVLTTTDINGGTIDGVTIGGTSAGAVTFTDLSDGTITITAFADEDDMSSDSATLVPTQQSVKAYVDSQVTAQDLDFLGDSGGALSIDLDSESLTIAGGTGLDTVGSGNTVTVNIDSTVATLTGTQTLTNKTLTSPDVNTPDIDGGTIDGTVIGGATPAAGTFTTLTANTSITGTLATAAQPNITSLGTLTGLDVAGTPTFDGLTVDGSADISGTITAGANNGIIKEIGSDLSLVQGAVGFRINDAASAISPTTASANNDNAVDLGVSNIRFKDIYLSGKLTNDGSGGISVDTSGNVGIGTTSPAYKLEVESSSDADLIQIQSTASANNTVLRLGISGDVATLNASGGSTGALAFKTYGSERMRIDTSGNLLVGKTAPTISTTGVELRPNGQVFATQSGNYPLLLNRTTSDGDIVQFRKDNTTVGSIGVINTNNITIGGSVSNHSGLQFGTAVITPMRAGVESDAQIDIGYSNARFKDLYFSGAVNLGDTYGVQWGDGNERITGVNTGNSLRFVTNNAEAMRIDASGNVGIGATSANSSRLRLDNGGTSGAPQLMLTATGASTQTEIRHDTSNNLIFENWNSGRTERMRIDSSGNVGLYDGQYINWRLAPNSTYRGGIRCDSSANMSFETGSGGAERMRIDASGNVLLGNTVVNPVSGFASQKGFGYAASTGKVEIATDANAAVMELGKNNANDGSILVFRKQSNVVGTINNSGTNLGIEGQSGIVFLGGDRTGSVRAINSHGSGQPRLDANNDNTTDLGTGANRFKDLYLSGGAYLGGTGSANHLDDYEEGTWTPTWTNGIGNGSTAGTYVKVGNIVHVTATFTMGSTTSIGNKLEANNLPFNCNGITYSGARYENYQSNSYIGMTRANANIIRGYVINVGGSQATEVIVSTNAPFTWGVNDYAQLSITYTI